MPTKKNSLPNDPFGRVERTSPPAGQSEVAAPNWRALLKQVRERHPDAAGAEYVIALQRAAEARDFAPLLALLDNQVDVMPDLLPAFAAVIRRLQTGKKAGSKILLTATQDENIRHYFNTFLFSEPALAAGGIEAFEPRPGHPEDGPAREIPFSALQVGKVINDLARIFKVSPSTVRRSLSRTEP